MKDAKVLKHYSILLMGALLVLYFMPFWQLEGKMVSIWDWMWFPSSNTALKAYFEAAGITANMGGIFAEGIILIVAPLAGIVFGVWKWDDFRTLFLPLIAGVTGVYGYITKPALHLGYGWIAHLIVCVALTLCSWVALVYETREMRQKFSAKMRRRKENRKMRVVNKKVRAIVWAVIAVIAVAAAVVYFVFLKPVTTEVATTETVATEVETTATGAETTETVATEAETTETVATEAETTETATTEEAETTETAATEAETTETAATEVETTETATTEA